MTLEQWISLFGAAWMVFTSAMLIGLWRGRQEAADKAAASAIANTEKAFDLRLKNLETQATAHAEKFDLRIRIVDGDINSLKASLVEVKMRMSDAEAERREEFQRLHKVGNETHGLIVQHLTKLQEAYIPRAEYEARHEDVERRVSRLEQK